MQGGIALKGEWIAGQPFDGTRTTGGYLDVTVHRPALGPVTACSAPSGSTTRSTPPRAMHAHRYTAGARVRVLDGLERAGKRPDPTRAEEGAAPHSTWRLTYVFRRD